MGKVFVLTAAACGLLLSSPVRADNIVVTATVDGVLVDTLTSVDGNLNINSQSFGPLFDLNTVTINAGPSFLAPPAILNTNTLDVNQTVAGSHTLVLDITAQNLAGTGALTNLLSEFSVTGLTTGWSAMEQTLIDGVVQATTPTIFANSSSADVTTAALLTNPFSAEAVYTINSNGIGEFNGGIDINAAVPAPVAGAGFPGMLTMLIGLGMLGWRRWHAASAD